MIYSEDNQRPHLGITMARPRQKRRLDIHLGGDSELGDLGSLFGDLLVAQMAAHHISDPTFATPEYLYLRRACWEEDSREGRQFSTSVDTMGGPCEPRLFFRRTKGGAMDHYGTVRCAGGGRARRRI
jgi:hypothetical protein